MRKYLLVDLSGRSRRGTLIEANRAAVNRQFGGEIVSQNIWECADSPLLAVMINPLHTECVRPRLFELRGIFKDKNICLNRIGEIDIPEVSAEQKLAFAMYCVRTLSPEHAFAAWVERWLANIDRSLVGAIMVRRELERTAEQTDQSLSSLSGFWGSPIDQSRICEQEFEFLRRARDVVEAAITLIEKPRQWRVTLAELVAVATSNMLDDSNKSEFASLAVSIFPAAPGRRQMSEPKRLFRRRDDAPDKPPSAGVYANYRGGELRNKDRGLTRPKR